MKRFVGLAAGFSLGLAAAVAAVTVPHTFVSGQQAKASEVNNNFSTVASAINSLASDLAALASTVGSHTTQISSLEAQPAPLRILDANNVALGTFLGMGGTGGAVHNSSLAMVRSSQGYLANVLVLENAATAYAGIVASSGSSGLYTGLFFATNDCTGQAYSGVTGYSSQTEGWAVGQGFVFASANKQTYYFAKGTPEAVGVVMQSAHSNAVDPQCVAASDVPLHVYPVAPNDPAVTGLPNNVARPLRLG